MNALGMPDNLQEASLEQLGWIKEIIQEIVVLSPGCSPAVKAINGLFAVCSEWPLVQSREEILKAIDDEIARRGN
jgi:hypothetical protein